MAHLTLEQRYAAEQRGSRFVKASAGQVATLSMQRRIFWVEEQAFLAVRPDGFLETAATLQALLAQPLPGVAPGPLLAVTAPPTDPAPQQSTPTEEGRDRPIASTPEASASVPRSTAPARADPVQPSPSALTHTARLVASYVATNAVAISDLDALIRGVYDAVAKAQAAH